VFLENHQEREPSMSEITTIGLDLAKHEGRELCTASWSDGQALFPVLLWHAADQSGGLFPW
jgi:hypothetical protein